LPCQVRMRLHELLVPADGTVLLVTLVRGSHDAAVTHNEVWPDDHADVVDLQALAGMDAADLVDGFLGDDPKAPVLAEVPLPTVVTNHDVVGEWILLAAPGPAVPRHDTRLVLVVAHLDRGMQRLGRIEYAEIILAGIEPIIGGRPDIEHVVQPREIAIRPAATKLGSQVVFLDEGALGHGELPDRLLAAHVTERDALVLVDEEDRALGGADQLLDLVLAEVGIQAALLVEAMRLIDDEHVEDIGLGIDEGSGTGEDVREPRSGDGPDELGLVDLPWRGVLRHVLADQAQRGVLHQEVDGQHRLAGTGPTLDDDDTGSLGRGCL